ncbi:single-stranded DNA-binding protein [Actinomycetospora flava]|uniref:Single-stranded DNA-binding protein n=1 Tax=Actinomycetospora flava TaxID=3129232 RepID=A0ABU8M5J8_9PSEU
MNETTLTIVGNLTDAPELRYLPSGAARAGFTVASTPRRFDRQTGEWIDGDALFLRAVAWGPLAEHAAESLSKGDRVVVTGRLRQRSFETAEGARRQVIELEVDEVGVSLRYATARPQRTSAPAPADRNGAAERVDDSAGDSADELVGGHD